MEKKTMEKFEKDFFALLMVVMGGKVVSFLQLTRSLSTISNTSDSK